MGMKEIFQINRIEISGYGCKKEQREIKESKNGKPYANFYIARSVLSKNPTKKYDYEYYKCMTWDAEVINKLTVLPEKGVWIVKGKLDISSYFDHLGKKITSYKIIVEDLITAEEFEQGFTESIEEFDIDEMPY